MVCDAAFANGRGAGPFAMDAARHMLAIGVVSMMIVGMAMLIVPEFAGRRLQPRASVRWSSRW